MKHYKLYTVKDALQTRPVRAAPSTRAKGGEAVRQAAQPAPLQIFNYELFYCYIFNIHYWSWNYPASIGKGGKEALNKGRFDINDTHNN